MNDLDSKIAEEIDDEALFRLADGEEREFSPEYQQNMERLYRKAGAHPRRRMKPIRRIIAIAAIVAVLTGAAAAATFWEEIQQFFVLNFGQYVELQTDREREIRREVFAVVPEEWASFWYPDMQLGYIVVNADSKAKQKIITFQNTDSEFKFYQWSDRKYMSTDSDTNIVYGIYVGDQEVYAIEREIDGAMYRTVFWTNDGTSFKLYGELSFDKISEIANSLVLIER